MFICRSQRFLSILKELSAFDLHVCIVRLYNFSPLYQTKCFEYIHVYTMFVGFFQKWLPFSFLNLLSQDISFILKPKKRTKISDMFNDESDSQVCKIYLVYNSSSVLDTCCSLTLFILHLSSSSC